MIAVSIDANKAAQHFRQASRAIDRAKGIAVKRAAGIIRRKESAALRSNSAKGVGGGKFPKLSAVHDLLNGPKSGGILKEGKQIKIKATAWEATVDWADHLRPYVQKWNAGGSFNGTDQTHRRAILHRLIAVKHGSATAKAVPILPTPQPPRPFLAPLRALVARDFPRWFHGALEKILVKGRAKENVWKVPFTTV